MTSTIIGLNRISRYLIPNWPGRRTTHSLHATLSSYRVEYRGRHRKDIAEPLVRFSIPPFFMRRSAYICPSFRRSISLPLQISRASYTVLPLHNQFFPTTRLAVKYHSSRTSATMSGTKMPASHGHSEACCNIPPIVVEGYEPKGKYETINGMKTCVSSSSTSNWESQITIANYPVRCHRPIHSLHRHPLRLRRLRLLPANPPRSRYPCHKRPRPPIPNLHARLFWRKGSWHLSVSSPLSRP